MSSLNKAPRQPLGNVSQIQPKRRAYSVSKAQLKPPLCEALEETAFTTPCLHEYCKPCGWCTVNSNCITLLCIQSVQRASKKSFSSLQAQSYFFHRCWLWKLQVKVDPKVREGSHFLCIAKILRAKLHSKLQVWNCICPQGLHWCLDQLHPCNRSSTNNC